MENKDYVSRIMSHVFSDPAVLFSELGMKYVYDHVKLSFVTQPDLFILFFFVTQTLQFLNLIIGHYYFFSSIFFNNNSNTNSAEIVPCVLHVKSICTAVLFKKLFLAYSDLLPNISLVGGQS